MAKFPQTYSPNKEKEEKPGAGDISSLTECLPNMYKL